MNKTTERAYMPANASDLALLRRFEPVLRFTRGEKFYPTDVETYVRSSSLWQHTPDDRDKQLVPEDELDLEKLVEPRPADFGAVQYLRFIEPLSLSEAAQALAEQARLNAGSDNVFHAGLGRLARGGLFPRILDALFSASFLLRGSVPTALAAAAELGYRNIHQAEKPFPYYGRVVRHNGWTILQYWYFYCYNDWRSAYNGVNDHEADWEHITIYLYEQDDLLIPEWVSFSSHDYQGDDLRRRWDDTSEIDFIDGHPVAYVAAGSHASYFRKGEYMAQVKLDLPDRIHTTFDIFSKLWVNALGQLPFNPFRIPFVEFARGDGFAIGAGQLATWSPDLIDENTPWVSQYRGLWGLFARDPISGENAPAGPMYNRDGSPRGSWYDPLGFCGLEKVPAPPKAINMLEENRQTIINRQRELEQEIPQKARELQILGAKIDSTQGNPHLAKQHASLEAVKDTLQEEVRAMRREFSENTALLQGINERLDRLKQGIKDHAHAHIRRLTAPVMIQQIRFERVAQTWAAISLSLLLLAVVGLMLFSPNDIGVGFAIITLSVLVIDGILRAAFVETLRFVTILLAISSALILLFHFWYWVLIGLMLAISISLMAQRLRELH